MVDFELDVWAFACMIEALKAPVYCNTNFGVLHTKTRVSPRGRGIKNVRLMALGTHTLILLCRRITPNLVIIIRIILTRHVDMHRPHTYSLVIIQGCGGFDDGVHVDAVGVMACV